MLTLRHNGNNLTNFKSARVLRDIEQLCGTFSFTSTANEDNLFPVRGGDEVEVLADGMPLLSGYVDIPDMKYSLTKHDIKISGRDKLSDLADSTIAKPVEFSPGIGIVTIAETVLADLGINVKVINKAGTIKNFSDTEKESSGVGENAFSFVESFARKRQILLTSDFESNLVLLRGNPGTLPKLQHIVPGDDNNVKSARFRENIKERYYKYIVQAQLDPYFQDVDMSAEDMASQVGRAFDNSVRKSRVLELISEESSNSETATERAIWEANIRRARSFMYTATVAGHSVNGKIWDYNNLSEIVDSFADLNGQFLCRQAEYLYDIGGSTTNLIYTYKDAFTLQAEQAQREASQGNQGEGFFSGL